MTLAYEKPLYILAFDHRALLAQELFGWQGPLSMKQTVENAAKNSAAKPQ